MTSAAPLSVVLTLFVKEKEEKRGRSGGHICKGYKDYKPLIPIEYLYFQFIFSSAISKSKLRQSRMISFISVRYL